MIEKKLGEAPPAFVLAGGEDALGSLAETCERLRRAGAGWILVSARDPRAATLRVERLAGVAAVREEADATAGAAAAGLAAILPRRWERVICVVAASTALSASDAGSLVGAASGGAPSASVAAGAVLPWDDVLAGGFRGAVR